MALGLMLIVASIDGFGLDTHLRFRLARFLQRYGKLNE